MEALDMSAIGAEFGGNYHTPQSSCGNLSNLSLRQTLTILT
jgi:hypothetical protein